MPTNTAAVSAREAPWQMLHYMRKTVNYSDTGLSSGIPFAQYLPAGASIAFAIVKIKTAFNAGTTNVLTVGQNSTDYNDIVNADDVNEAATGSYMIARGGDLTISAAVRAYIKYTQTGSAATTGQAEVTLYYTVNNDE